MGIWYNYYDNGRKISEGPYNIVTYESDRKTYSGIIPVTFVDYSDSESNRNGVHRRERETEESKVWNDMGDSTDKERY